MILHHDSANPITTGPGIVRRTLVHGPQLMLVEYTFEAGRDLPVHTHPHEQVGYVVSGRLRLSFDGAFHELSAGDSYHVPPNVAHGATVLEPSVVIDAFTPPREDFLDAPTS